MLRTLCRLMWTLPISEQEFDDLRDMRFKLEYLLTVCVDYVKLEVWNEEG